ncbi:MAG: hypothetical protein Q8P20_07830 [bacterium]|nr:hypothetical protein [bacterium]
MGQKNTLMIVIIILVVAGGALLAWYFLQEDEAINTNTATNTTTTNTTLNTAVEKPVKNTVWIMDGSFNPSVVTVKVGDTVTWVNKDDIDRQVASDPHPTHTALPDLESNALSVSDVYTFTFDEVGTWFYHDHLNPIQKGTVIVE